MKVGVYKIEHFPTGRLYIGSSCRVPTRLRNHRQALVAGKHVNKFLQAAWNKYGSKEFIFTPVIFCEEKDLLFYEQTLIDGFETVRRGFNFAPVAGSRRGVPASDKVRLASRNTCKKRLGKLHPLYGKARPECSNAMKALNKNPEIIEKRRAAIIAANKRRVGAAHPMFGKKRPDLAERNKKRGVECAT